MYRIERTELATRVFLVEADNEDDALDNYSNEPVFEEYHAGHPDVRITEVKPGDHAYRV